MTAVGAVAGWITAGVAVGVLLAVRRAVADRMAAVARACHELRGPLTAARLGLALPGGGDALPRGRLRAIDAELGRAALALEDLAEIRGGGPRLRHVERVDVRRLVADSVEAWQGAARAADTAIAAVATDPGPGAGAEGAAMVDGDRRRLGQAVGNLLANAIEHGGPRVAVSVAQRGDLVRVEVSDDGRGLPAPVAELSRRGRRARGAHGHGLAIAVAVAEAHGGRLAAAPAHVGARLVLELPASGPSRWPRSIRAVTPAPSRRPSAAR
jgi:signal transduction histidine kinase